jgi:hypothetical protein
MINSFTKVTSVNGFHEWVTSNRTGRDNVILDQTVPVFVAYAGVVLQIKFSKSMIVCECIVPEYHVCAKQAAFVMLNDRERGS